MKKILTVLFAAFVVIQLHAQSPKSEASGQIDGVNIEVVYHSPSVRGRTIMGSLVPYGKVWRTGANNATTIEFDQDVKIEGQDLEAGRYALFTIPNKDSWTIIFNSKADQWGAFNYSEDLDILRVDVSPSSMAQLVESMKIEVGDGEISIAWENTRVSFSVSK